MNDNHVIEVNEADFNEKIIEASKSTLLIVDFWAPWCGPCKQLTPLLEKIVNEARGKVILAKINIDENQQIAAQLRIQSIPAVFAFKDGQPIDAFQGMIPENKIIEFIEKSLGEKLKKDNSKFYQFIKKLFNEKKFVESLNEIEAFISENPEDFKGIGLYIESLCFLEKYNEADNLLESLNDKALENQYIKSSIQKLEIKKKNSKGPTLENLKDQFAQKPNDFETIITLADKYFAENMLDDSFELLLKKYNKHKNPVKKKILELFTALGNDHEKTREYRKKLSSIMFS